MGLVAGRVVEGYTKEDSLKLPPKWWLTASAEENLYYWIGNQ